MKRYGLRSVRSTARSKMLVALVAAGGGIAGASLVLAHASGAGPNSDATSMFSVFKSLPATAPPSEVASSPSLSRADIARTRELGINLGRFRSRLFISPANNNQSVCYGLIGASSTDPGMVYCYSPHAPAPPEIAGEHFSVAAPESVIDGKVGVQLFGVVEDDVRSARVQIAGEWRRVPLQHNGFYLDLPGVSYDQLGHFEVTLKDGSVQVHDIPTATQVG